MRGATMCAVTRGGAAQLAAGTAVAAIGTGSVAIARHSPTFSLAGDSTGASLLELLAGWCLAGAGLVAWARRPHSTAGPVLVGAGAAWFLVEWNNPGVESPLVYTLGLVLFGACPALVAHAVLAYPGGRPATRADGVIVAIAYVGAVLALGLVPALFFDRVAEGCGGCPADLVQLGGDPGTYRALSRAGVVLGLGWSLLLLALLTWRVTVASPARRRLRAPVLAPACAYLALVALDFAHSVGRGLESNDLTDRRLWLGQALALLGVAGGVLWEWGRARRTRAQLARVVVDFGASPLPGRLRDVLAQQLGDPALELVYAHSGQGWVDFEGRPAAARPGAGFTWLVADGRAVAALVHRPELLDDAHLADEIAATTRLALEHERLHAEVRAQTAHLRASRARIVAAAAAERERLERDLHDGAQQRLVTLTLAIRLTARGLDRDHARLAPGLERTEQDVRAALGELREVAHGLHPMALTDGGLCGALEALAERSPRIAAGAVTAERFHPTIESAAYFVIAEVLKGAGARRLDVDIGRAGGCLVVELRGEGLAAVELIDVEDRVGALDGRLTIDARDGESCIRAELPCA